MRIFLKPARAAFTMVEIALCLAIVGFALIAIIGSLPIGMNTQKDNREQTIINQDAAVWLAAIQNGSQGYNDLTNHVMAITNFWTEFETNSGSPNYTVGASGVNGYTISGSSVSWPTGIPDGGLALTNGARIIGLLSTPKYVPLAGPASGGTYTSNYVVAYVRALSGAAVEKAPQANQDILDSAFAYRMVVEIPPYVPLEQSSTGPAEVRLRNIFWSNAHDVRLLFRWPLFPNSIGNGRQTFRALTTGQLISTNDPVTVDHPLFYLEPSVVR